MIAGFRLSLEHHASCVTCDRNVGRGAKDDAIEALVFGLASVYAICPSCFQKPSDETDEEYRRRVRVVLFEKYRIVVLADGRARYAANACPECGSEMYRTKMERTPDRREVDVVACSGCEHVEEEGVSK